MPGEQLEEDDAGAPEVALATIVPIENFWCSVQQRARNGVLRREILCRLCEAKVQQLQHLCGGVFKPKVFGFDVTVHDVEAMYSGHSRKDVLSQQAYSVNGKVITLLLHVVDEIQTTTTPHNGVKRIIRLNEAMVLHDVGMIYPQALGEHIALLPLTNFDKPRCMSTLHWNDLHTQCLLGLRMYVLASEDLTEATLPNFLAYAVQLLELSTAPVEPDNKCLGR
mmetsp:Transcript_98099/g.281947  ORF Transcript_98099/g.281947 Transcript_98099/m.281947 type:complete len:223 (+) Transcript_98099:482-1150(+)